jgi:hypothetical protein
MFANLRAWHLRLWLLISLSNELGMVSTLIVFFLKGFSIASSKFEKLKLTSTINKCVCVHKVLTK